MSKRIVMALLFGLVGAGVLIALGVWQVERLAWKEAVLAEIAAGIAAEPVALPVAPEDARDRYLPVTVTGRVLEGEIVVLASLRQAGPVYRIIRAFETAGGRRVLVDLGFVHPNARDRARPGGPAEIVGNLYWPDEVDGFTPAPDQDAGLWFARDLPAMAAELETEPVLIVAREAPQGMDWVTVFPVDASGIPNDHLGYAVTWFLLAFVWMGMTGFLVWRISRTPN